MAKNEKLLKKSFIIVDELNIWRATGTNYTPEEVAETILEVKTAMQQEGNKGTTMFIYEFVGEPIEVKW